MRNKSLIHAAVASLALLGATATQAQTYSNAVATMNPAPVGYWPLQETTPPPTPGSLNLTAHNSGTLGTAGDGLYGAWYQANGASWYVTNSVVLTNAGYTGDGSKALLCQSVYTTYIPGQYVVVPHATNGVNNDALTIKPPFSVECWAYIGSTNAVARVLVSQGATRLDCGGSDPNNQFNGGTFLGLAGFELAQYRDYLFFMPLATNGVTKPELDTPPGYNGGVNGAGLKVGTLLHIVATMDTTGTKTIYTNGVLCATSGSPVNKAGLTYVPDPISPIMIGAGPEPSVSRVVPAESIYNPYSGVLDDVAIYTNALTVGQAMAHYQAAANGTYAATVQADSPLLFYRFDDAITPANAGYNTASFPTANNYGLAGATANGLYQPGTTPGVAGPSYSGFGANSRAVAFNGAFGTVNVGNGNLPVSLNPTGAVPVTVVSWFKGAPADAPGRFEEIVGHSDRSYRLALGQVAGENHFNPGPGPELQFTVMQDATTNGFMLNDGKWHMVAGVSDGTNESMYLDGRLAKTASNASGISIVGTNLDLVLGGDPQYTSASGTGENTIRNFDGSIAHVAVWTNALSTAQIQGLFLAAGVPPTITQQPPATTNLNAGSSLSVTVVARDVAPLTYQWYKNGSALPTQTTSTLALNSLQLSDAGTYYVQVSNPAASTSSSTMTLTVNGPLVLNQQSPTDVRVFVGTRPVLHATVTGPSPSYQWSKNGSPISGATQSAYPLSRTTDTGATGSSTYSCTITNAYGPVSGFHTITVQVLPAPTTPFPAQVLADNAAYYFRLDEADNNQGNGNAGVTAYDYAGGCNALYTNTTLGNPGYSPSSDPTETSAYFGYVANPDSYAGKGSIYADFSAPAGSNAQFSVEAWINASSEPSTDAGVVAVGYGYGGEQFAIDCGAKPTNGGGHRALRFYINDASGVNHGVTAPSTTNIWSDGLWHHIVGVCDEAGGNLSLYVDGLLASTPAVLTPGTGLKALTEPLSIGARRSDGVTVPYTNQFVGTINDVALYNVALSSNQVVNHYVSVGVAPRIVQAPPASISTNAGATVTMSVSAIGSPSLTYQWQVNYADIPGATTPTLTLNNVDGSMNGYFYSCNINNGYGSASTANNGGTYLYVNAGPPTLTVDISPLVSSNYTGKPTTYSVVVNGTAPFTYQWYQDGSTVTGANASSYTVATLSGQHTYYVHVSNQYGSTNSSTAHLTGVASPTLNASAYNYKAKITFSGYNAGEVLSDFPALVVLTNIPGFAYSQFASPTGGDLRFTDSTGTNEIPCEIDDWNPAGNSTAWVRVPRLATTNDYIMAYWGNAAAITPEAWSTNGGVWVPQPFEGLPAYNIVYHLKEGAAPYLDSTTLHTATNSQVPAATAPGIAGTAASFAGNNYLDAGVDDFGDVFTLSAWLNIPNGTSDIQGVWMEMHGGYGAPGYGLWVNTYQHSDQIIEFGAGGSSGTEIHGPAFPFGAWHQLEAAVNRTNGTVTMYVDGASVGQFTGVPKDFYQTNSVRLGEFIDNNFGFHGAMDEARIQSGNSSANWIWADYMTMAHNNTFQNYGPALSSKVYITAHVSGGNLVLSWPAGTLWAAPTVNGPWHSVTSTSPYTVPMTGPAQFFRLQ